MKATTLLLVLIFAFAISMNSALASPGATVPWTTYEAENMSNTGTILGPTYSNNVVSSESSGRQCVRLSTNGSYVQFTALSNATAIVARYSVPDTSDGVGADYTFSLYKNGTLVGRLPVTSKYSWLYGRYPFSNDPSQGSPRNFFNEVRTNGVSIAAGDVIKLQKDAGFDAASYYDIDLVDLENVPAPLSQPGGFVSIKSAPYNAVGDGVTDDTAALTNCIGTNSNVWIPPGSYRITGSAEVPSNRTIRGAGIWYSSLVGDPVLYTNGTRRVRLVGTGSNIHLSDFAIVGKLNYRNDKEPNDGLGGAYGTGSTISNVWVEHTKTGAWIVNSRGLVVSSCRFRDTIADGINLCVGMQSTLVTNCATRGTGDDCFAIWPAKHMTPVYAPGQNVITHCTGQVPFLAQGGAIYGGDGNRIEDCLFQDIPYECGILISTTFPVSHNFSGTTVAQRCDLIRCGGTRAGLEINLHHRDISGVNLNNLNITNSGSHGMRIVNGAGALSDAIMYNSTISTYGLSGGGAHGLWARHDAVGSLTVSNCNVAEYQNDSPNFLFASLSTNVTVWPPSLPAAFAGTAYSQTITANSGTSPYTFAMTSGSLPAGLTLSSGGALSGTPTTPGMNTFEVTATDAASQTSARTYTLVTKNHVCFAVTPNAAAAPFTLDTSTPNFSISTGNVVHSDSPVTIPASLIDPAPIEVYRNERWYNGTMTYTFSNLTAGNSYNVRFHFAETAFASSNQRRFNVSTNDAPWLTNYDIFDSAGGPNIAVITNATVVANSNGNIVITFSKGSIENPKINGIEILPASSPIYRVGSQ